MKIMSTRKIIIPKGLVQNPEQNSIIEVSPRLNQTSGNLIAKRQGKKLVAQQLPEWHDALSSPGGKAPQNSFVATPTGCRPPTSSETFQSAASTSGASASRANESFYSAYSTGGRTRDNTTFYSAASSLDDYQSALTPHPDATYSKTCYSTSLDESPSRAHLTFTGNDSNLHSTIESNVQMTDAMLANIVNETRTILPSPGGRLQNVRQRLFSSDSSPSPAADQTYARINLTRDNFESPPEQETSSRRRVFDAPNATRVIPQRPGNISNVRRQLFDETSSSSGSSRCSPCQSGQAQHAMGETFARPSPRAVPQLDKSLEHFILQVPKDPGLRGIREAYSEFGHENISPDDYVGHRSKNRFQNASSGGRRKPFTSRDVSAESSGIFSESNSADQSVHSPCNRQQALGGVRNRLFATHDESSFNQVENKTFDVPRSPSSRADQGCPCSHAPASPEQYHEFQPNFFSTPQRTGQAANQTYLRPAANATFHRAGGTASQLGSPRVNQTFARPALNLTGPRCGGALRDNNQTYARPDMHQTYDPNYSPYSTLEDSDAYVPTSPKSVPRSKARRTGRPRPGQDTYPRSFNRSNIEDGSFMDSDNFWSDYSPPSYIHQTPSPPRQLKETITDLPTDESYDMRFNPMLSSTNQSFSEVYDSSEDLMCGFGVVDRSDEGKYNIITPMTPSPKKAQVKDCNCAPEAPESLVSYSSQVVEDVYEEQ